MILPNPPTFTPPLLGKSPKRDRGGGKVDGIPLIAGFSITTAPLRTGKNNHLDSINISSIGIIMKAETDCKNTEIKDLICKLFGSKSVLLKLFLRKYYFKLGNL